MVTRNDRAPPHGSRIGQVLVISRASGRENLCSDQRRYDKVFVGGTMGRLRHIRILVTKVRETDKFIYIVPSGWESILQAVTLIPSNEQ